MNKTVTEIVERLLGNGSITAEEAVVLLKAELNGNQGITYIPYNPTPFYPNPPDWTYDPNRPGQPYWGGISSTGDFVGTPNTTTNE